MKVTLKQRLQTRFSVAQTWWVRRAPREQLILLCAAAVLACLLVWLLLWQPAANGIRQLDVELRELRTQSAALQAMADEARSLRATARAAVPLPAGQRLGAVQQGLERAGITAQTASEGTTRVRVSMADVDYAAWATWLASAETELGARTARAELMALNPASSPNFVAGHVRVEVLLDFAPGSASVTAVDKASP
jgi:general secretion pathway protein M